jgi:hypothetical protein
VTSKQADFLVKLRDAGQIIFEAANELLTSMAPPESGLGNDHAAVGEITFTTLKWDGQTGSKLGDFEVAPKATNIQDKWQHAFNILRNSNATIKTRYYGESYSHSYWIYGQDKIYRQKLKPQTSTGDQHS